MKNSIKKTIAVARGLIKADLVLKKGIVANVHSGELYQTDIAIAGDKIAGLGDYEGRKIIDVSGKFVLPGLIDSHVHIESSLLTPPEFARAALPHGTTAVVADPHEIANVLGKKGIAYMLRAAGDQLLDFYFMLPSCVPATRLETSGARLNSSDLSPLLKHERVLGLAELMDYRGVLSAEPSVLRKLYAFSQRLVDGHAPGLSGKDLSAYAGAGISSDHECVSAEEAREKVRLGMTIYVREGSSAKDLEALLPAITHSNSRFFTLATDDFHPLDLKKGGINLLIKKAVRLGLDPVTAIQMATINPARHFGLARKGAILPGYDADLIVVDGFENMSVEKVFKSGRLVAENGECAATNRRTKHGDARNTVRIRPVTRSAIRIRAASDYARVIELIPDQIETKHTILPVTAQDGVIIPDTKRDILKLLVIERHGATGRIGKGLVKGFGLAAGALAGTVSHDSHNIIVVGANDDDILYAVARINRLQGGLVVVSGKKVLAEIPLPIAGLMSDKPLDFVVKKLTEIERAVKNLGVKIEHPFGILSFLALPVIPELKLTDRGLVDVRRFKFVDLSV